MAEHDGDDTGFIPLFAGFPQLCAGALAGLGSGLWLNVVGPFAGLVAAWGALVLVNTLAVAVVAVLAMLVTTAGTLLAADWRAEVPSRQARTEIGVAAAEFRLPIGTAALPQIDPRYLSATDTEALRSVFRAHRFAPPAPALQTITQMPAAICAPRIGTSAEPIPALTTRDVAPEITCHQGISAAVVSEVRISGRALRKRASTVPAEAATTVTSRRGLPFALRAGRAAPRIRLVANANVWSGWPGRDECILTRTLPGRHTADVVVLSSSWDDRNRLPPEACKRGSIASSTEPPSCRGPPQVVGHRSRATETMPASLSGKSARQGPGAGALPTADPIVRDNLGPQVSVCTAELDVIETYLDHVLRDLLASSTAGSAQEEV